MFSKAKSEKNLQDNAPANKDGPAKKDSSAKKESVGRNPSPATPPSIIAANMTVTGDLNCEGEVQVDGKIHGDVHCDKLTIGQEGEIDGSVVAERALLRGKISGRIEAKSVTLMSTATVIGDIVHEALTIEPGAYMEGHCRRMEKGQPSSAGGSKTIDLVVNEGELTTA